ncbi:MAG: sugar phosphate isomerase/epimerase family protein [Vicinamibacterales bacterium]
MFGISTHLYHLERLSRDHLVEIAAHGFDAVEVFATRDHFDYHDKVAAHDLAEWLSDTRLTLNSLHGPIAVSFSNGRWRDPYNLAATDDNARRVAVAETRAALELAAVVPYRLLVVHAGAVGDGQPRAETRKAILRSLDELAPLASKVGVRLAVEVIPNTLSGASALVTLIEEEVDLPALGICLDVGHARLMGDVVDAIETCSGHIVTTHLHDNRGKTDDHLIPGQGVIDWDAAMLAFQKVGYDGAWMFELAMSATPREVLEKAVRARARLESLLHVGDEMLGEN